MVTTIGKTMSREIGGMCSLANSNAEERDKEREKERGRKREWVKKPPSQEKQNKTKKQQGCPFTRSPLSTALFFSFSFRAFHAFTS